MLKKNESVVRIPHSTYPRIWHILYADEFTCLEGDQGVITGLLDATPDFLQYHIQLLNPDALGNPLEHFGDEETGQCVCIKLTFSNMVSRVSGWVSDWASEWVSGWVSGHVSEV
jgi:hypothetical protein